ncbi:MAG: two-component system, chemotaxis family, protein-glutamate methylesterase/glutaminase [Chthoniobacter sp.]|nr:two-component system, chemotaxis family, protein-glutamate methylesterase/glutaminase [Chthoniobacter sp.]
MTTRPIRLLIVEDSAASRELLQHIFGKDEGIEVAGVARDGEEAVALAAELGPDVITMDIHLPKLNGFETTRRIMESNPAPIIIVSASADPGDVRKAFQVMDAGAVAVLETPRGLGDPRHDAMAAKLVRTVKLMSEVRVVKRTRRSLPPTNEPVAVATPVQTNRQIDLIAIGASTGGPPALHTILSGLKTTDRPPILIVQHIAGGFVQGLVDWLAQSTGLSVVLASDGVRPLPGHVYIAPDELHMIVEKSGLIALSDHPPDNGLRPAVSRLFESVAEVFGPAAVGVLLTGMGVDGAAGLKQMRDRGAVTFAQDRESSVVFGMPGEAVKIGAAEHVLSPVRIAATLDTLLNKNKQADRK